MNLVMITPFVGRSNPIFAFIPGWIRALAAELNHLYVITPRYEEAPFPENVTVIEVGRNYARGETVFHALLKLHRALWSLTRSGQVDGIFTHMYPNFALLAAPYAKLNRIPLIMWFTHTHVSTRLKLASIFADRIVTAQKETCQLDSPKVTPIGHGIDTNYFTGPEPEAQKTGQMLLAVGRISPSKQLDVIIAAVRILVHEKGFRDLKLVIAGGPPNHEGAVYLESLRSTVAASQLEPNVVFRGSVPYDQVRTLYRQSDLLVSASVTGVDKAILEAMACELPIVISTSPFRDILGEQAAELMYPPGDSTSLAERIQGLVRLPEESRRQIGKQMRAMIQNNHQTEGLARKIVALFNEVRTGKGGRHAA